MARIKEEAEIVKADVIIDDIGSTVTKSDLIIALKEHFEGSTLENGRVVVENGKYDIVVKNNLDIVVVKHGEDIALEADEIGITYEVENVNSETKKIKVYLELAGYKPYEEYAAEFLADKGTEELEELLLKSMCYIGKFDEFLSENNMTREQLEQQAQDNGMTYDEYLKLSLTEGDGNIPWVEVEYGVMLAGGEGKDQTGLENLFVESIGYPGTFDDFIVNELKTTREDFLTFVQGNGFRTEEDFVKALICEIYSSEEITVTCSNGETVTTNRDELYAEFTVTKNVIYTITAETESGKNGKAIVEMGEKFSQLYKATAKYVDNGKTAWIPAGFAVGISEGINSIDSGLVITDSVDSNGYSNGNEFVWVPVSEESFGNMFKTAEPEVALSGSTNVTSSYYSNLRVRSGESFTIATVTNGAYSSTSAIREPDLVIRFDSTCYNQVGYGSAKEMAEGFVEDYTNMRASIKKYKGFYIGRYELTGTVANPTVQSGTVLTASSSQAKNWYGLYKACRNVVTENIHVTTTMIWGCQWDETMNWLKNTKFKNNPNAVDVDSSSWGNCSNSTGNAQVMKEDGTTRAWGSPQITGYSDYWSANNIYDLAGNYYEWTQETHDVVRRTRRGRLLWQFGF